MIIDVHTHIWDSPDQLGADALSRFRSAQPEPWARPNASPEAHEEAMEPVDYSIVLGFVSQRLGASIKADKVAEYVDRQPDRRIGFAGLDPMADDCMDELARAIQLGLTGVTISPGGQGFHPCHTSALSLYEKCEAQGFPVMVHPGAQFSTDAVMEFAQPHFFDEVARQFPGLKLILAQVGHPWLDPTLTLIGKHKNIWADLSDLVLRPWPLYNVLLAAHQQGVIDRLLLGSDFPFCTPEQAITTIYSVNTYTQGTHLPSVPREQLRSIVERDSLAALGLSPPNRTKGHADSALEPSTEAKAESDRPTESTIEQGIV